jgi:hypothetical protein
MNQNSGLERVIRAVVSEMMLRDAAEFVVKQLVQPPSCFFLPVFHLGQ